MDAQTRSKSVEERVDNRIGSTEAEDFADEILENFNAVVGFVEDVVKFGFGNVPRYSWASIHPPETILIQSICSRF